MSKTRYVIDQKNTKTKKLRQKYRTISIKKQYASHFQTQTWVAVW